ncbi:MAG: transposase [Deltaproteobacteria bacterium]|nr:transposase [Deltaproteobacteria bacterium]
MFSVSPGYCRKEPTAKPKLAAYTGVIDGILDDDLTRTHRSGPSYNERNRPDLSAVVQWRTALELETTVKKSRFSEEQVIGILKEHEAGTAVEDITRRHGISAGTLYRWKANCGGLEVSDAMRLNALEEENR